jgi:hypothetical protein
MYRCVVEGDCVMGGDVVRGGLWICEVATESRPALSESAGAAFAQAAASRPPAIEIQETSNNRLRMPRGGVE